MLLDFDVGYTEMTSFTAIQVTVQAYYQRCSYEFIDTRRMTK